MLVTIPKKSPLTSGSLTYGAESLTIVLLLIFESMIFIIIAVYWGYLKSILWRGLVLCDKYYQKIKMSTKINPLSSKTKKKNKSDMELYIDVEDANIPEDKDVKAERLRVLDKKHHNETMVLLNGIHKEYMKADNTPKVVLDNISIAIESNMVFGLLGPNGAGKTTLFGILSGIIKPDSGTAKIAKYNVQKNAEAIYRIIGICPQFDCLWDTLTCSEHLYFYARLKGIDYIDEAYAVEQSLYAVELSEYANTKTCKLSGGQKRRLSIAIALVGNPAVVFLDEPTTGLDPEVRRLIWNIINKAKQNKTIIMTTHSMEEAEVCCNRLAIMAKGTLRCIGSHLRLKQRFGAGYKIHFSVSQKEQMEMAKHFVNRLLESNKLRLLENYHLSATFGFKAKKGELATIFLNMEKQYASHGIIDWGISQTNLEEVFMKIISDKDAEAE